MQRWLWPGQVALQWYLEVHKLHGGLSLETQGLGNEGVQILQAQGVHLQKERAALALATVSSQLGQF